jgi:MoaA/NifB/PqqE/SkfB family radical SAM enzyme
MNPKKIIEEETMNSIKIVNWLLTRRCNLKCGYCRIVRDYHNIPDEYPTMKYYYRNEMDTDFVIEILKRLKLHNPECFHIFYGGEPALRKDLPEIINYCNKNDIPYTIITNNTDAVQPMLETLLKSTSYVMGLTSSVDPMIITNSSDSDRAKKSADAISRLPQYRGNIKDLVAEVTVDNRNIEGLYDTVKILSDQGISSCINFIDIAKSPYYDFSNVTDKSLLVHRSAELQNQLDRIVQEGLDVHMAKDLFPRIWKMLPSDLDCGIEKDVHNLCIDSDGTVRLCLRIRGVSTPSLKADDFIDGSGNIDLVIKKLFKADKDSYCKFCNHTCMIMSKLISDDESLIDEQHHGEKRREE